jgi:hypothetical protein
MSERMMNGERMKAVAKIVTANSLWSNSEVSGIPCLPELDLGAVPTDGYGGGDANRGGVNQSEP